MQEYLAGLVGSDNLREELNLSTRVCCRLTDPPGASPVTDTVSGHPGIAGVIFNSSVQSDCIICQESIVEYSLVEAKVSKLLVHF